MKLLLNLSENETERLESTARRLGLRPEELARAALSDLLSKPQEDFEKATDYILKKNRDLYKRLS